MMWVTILPLIIDLIKEAMKLVSTIPDPLEKSATREGLRCVLQDFDVHQDVEVLRSSLRVFNEGAKR